MELDEEELEVTKNLNEKMSKKCNKCQSTKLFVEIDGTRRGLYCGECGKWQKWITKQELQICKFNNIKIINK